MRFIRKTSPPGVLTAWTASQNAAGISPQYHDFRGKAELNNHLREEQGHVCCYCQQRINQFPGDAHNEHLIPQRGRYGDPTKALDYSNLYASCSYSKGMKPGKRYCGEAKSDSQLPPLIQQPDCAERFAFNVLGEILPACGSYRSYQEFQQNQVVLSARSLETLNTINVLNLNASYLMEERKKTLFLVLKFVQKYPGRARELAPALDTAPRLRPFVELVLFYLR